MHPACAGDTSVPLVLAGKIPATPVQARFLPLQYRQDACNSSKTASLYTAITSEDTVNNPTNHNSQPTIASTHNQLMFQCTILHQKYVDT